MDTKIADIAALAARAQDRGIIDPARIADELCGLIERNESYLRYRVSHGRNGSYDEQVARDNEVLALAVRILEEHVEAERASSVAAFNMAPTPPMKRAVSRVRSTRIKRRWPPLYDDDE